MTAFSFLKSIQYLHEPSYHHNSRRPWTMTWSNHTEFKHFLDLSVTHPLQCCRDTPHWLPDRSSCGHNLMLPKWGCKQITKLVVSCVFSAPDKSLWDKLNSGFSGVRGETSGSCSSSTMCTNCRGTNSSPCRVLRWLG